jgi:HK97 family phage prohead protease
MALVSLRREAYGQPGMLTKAYDPIELKAEDGEGRVSGYASKWWVVDSYLEATAPGSFAQSIRERGPKAANRIPFRYEHQWTVGNHADLVEDGTGLYIDADIVDDGMYGTVLRKHLASANAPTYGLSIGYRTLMGRVATEADPLIWDFAPEWAKRQPDPSMVYVLQNNLLKENSAVTFPAVDNALIETYKADATHQLETILARVKSGTLTPTQLGLLREIAAAMPAARAPENGQEPSLPGAKADGGADDDLFAELDMTLALFERAA